MSGEIARFGLRLRSKVSGNGPTVLPNKQNFDLDKNFITA
jgi:hypothetical protein